MGEKLEKMAAAVQPSFWAQSGAWIVGITLCASLFGNCVLYQSYRDEERQHAWFARDAEQDRHSAEAERLENDRLRSDIEQMTSAIPPGGISTGAGEAVYRDCLRHKVGLEFSPYLLVRPGEWYYVAFRVHNTGTLRNRRGASFSLGGPCDVDPDARLKIIGETDLDYFLGLTGQEERGITSCPAGAYHLVYKTDRVIESAIADTCLAKAKASELDPNLR